MLPEFEKAIPKPLKKRYRDLVISDVDSKADINNLQNVAANKLFGNDEENVNYPLHKSGNFFRNSVITCSAKNISIIADIGKLPSTLKTNGRGAKVLSRLQQSMRNSPYLLEDVGDGIVSYLINSPAVKFTGKLKVKWRQKYENLNSGCENCEPKEENGADIRETKTVMISRKVASTAGSRKVKTNSKISCPPDNKTYTATGETQEESSTMKKLERARKGLIYQKFMASSYSWNKKERNSTKTAEPAEPAQKRKRGRPRLTAPKIVKDNTNTEKSSSDDNSKPGSITLRLEGKRKNSIMEYAVVDSKKSKMTACGKKMSLASPECLSCGLTRSAPASSSSTGKSTTKLSSSEQVCRCYVADDIKLIFDDIKVKQSKKTK